MKTARKILLPLLCAVLLVGASVAGTLAYLTSNDKVENTFTVGKVEIELKESVVNEYGVKPTTNPTPAPTTGNQYKLIPGHTYTKDPTITVGSESEECWLFVKVENGLGDHAKINWETVAQAGQGIWEAVEGAEGYWVYSKTATAGQKIQVFPSFTYGSNMTDTEVNADGATGDNAKKIVVTAYAIQKDGFNNATAAWSALNTQLKLTTTGD